MNGHYQMTPNSPASPPGAYGGTRHHGWLAALLPLLAAVGGLALGIGFHLFTGFLVQHGPRVAGLAFNGNGATVVPFCIAPAVLIAGVVLLALRRAYLAATLFAVAFIVGFVVLGPL